jgi:hypothetical protein
MTFLIAELTGELYEPRSRGKAADIARTNYKIMIPLPPKIDPSVTMMQVGLIGAFQSRLR